MMAASDFTDAFLSIPRRWDEVVNTDLVGTEAVINYSPDQSVGPSVTTVTEGRQSKVRFVPVLFLMRL